jgi:hypothetical protein
MPDTSPFKQGDRLQLDFMGVDPDPVPVGTQGTVIQDAVKWFDGEWQVSVKWDNGRWLALCCPPDRAHKI